MITPFLTLAGIPETVVILCGALVTVAGLWRLGRP